MGEFIFHILKINLFAAAGIVMVMFGSKVLNKNYSVRWKYWTWLFLSLFLLFPVNFSKITGVWEIQIPQRESVPYAGQGLNSPGISENQNSQVKDSWISKEPVKNGKADGTVTNGNKRHAGSEGFMTVNSWNGVDIICIVWIAGIVLTVVYQMAAYRIASKKLRRWGIVVTNTSALRIYRLVCDRMGIRRAPKILVNNSLGSPLLTGILHPCLYLPARKYSASQLELVFQHELCHYKRRDLWYKLLLLTVRTVYWFHPALYFMVREADRDLEFLCDEYVVQGKSREECLLYNRLLLDTAACGRRDVRYLSASMNDGKINFKRRIKNVMKSGKLKKSIVPMLVLAVLISTGSGLIGCSVKENSAADEKKDIKIESSVSASSPAPTEAEEKTEPVTAIDAEKLDGMLPVFDSLIRYHEESDKDLKYDSQNAGYVWGALYYLMVNYAVAGENGVTQTEDYEKISVPAETVLRCAQGMFADMKELPPIPEDKGGIQYQEEEDRYLFEMSDKSEAVTKIESYVRDSDGTYLVHVSYTQTAPYTFRIVNNVLAEEDKTPVFYYAVQEIVSK